MRIWLLGLPLLLWIHSCAALPVLPPRTPSPEYLLEQTRARLQNLEGLKGLAHLTFSSGGKSFGVQEVLLVRRPAWLRAESLGPLGTPQFYLVTDGRELILFNPGENRYSRGPATAEHLAPFLPLPLKPEEIVSLLLGDPPMIDYDIASIRRLEEEGLWTLELSSTLRQERQILWVNPFSWNILRAEIYRPALSQRLIFEDFRRSQDFLFPQKIQVRSFQPEARLTVEYLEVELNPRWGPQDFQLPAPPGIAVFPLP
jgi:outer membrane lipoprotein-sorting protein